MIIGITLTKEATFRGTAESFSNVYHYDMESNVLLQSGWQDFANALAAKEKACHSSQVAFKKWIVWGPTDQGPAASKVITEGTLSGQGTLAGPDIYPEFAVVVSWFIGRSPTTNRKRFLRKYIHPYALPSTTPSLGLVGRAAIGDAGKAPFVTYADAVKNVAVGADSYAICAPNGDHLPLNTVAKILDYLHIRQLHQ